MSEKIPSIDPHTYIKRIMESLAEAGIDYEPTSYRYISPTGKSITDEELKAKQIVNMRIPELEEEIKEE